MELGPDIVLMDLNMPGIGGIEATHRITACSDAAVLVLTMASDDESVFAAILAGASGYLIKGADRGEVLRAVLGAAAGEAVLRARDCPPDPRLPSGVTRPPCRGTVSAVRRLREVGCRARGAAVEIDKAKLMLDSGAIMPAEFDAIKTEALA